MLRLHVSRRSASRALRGFFSVVTLAWLTSTGAGIHAAPPPPDALDYAKGYLITGNYVASGVDLTEQANPVDVNGMSTGTIHIARCTGTVTFNCVPQDADIMSAYLYFETITLTSNLGAA